MLYVQYMCLLLSMYAVENMCFAQFPVSRHHRVTASVRPLTASEWISIKVQIRRLTSFHGRSCDMTFIFPIAYFSWCIVDHRDDNSCPLEAAATSKYVCHQPTISIIPYIMLIMTTNYYTSNNKQKFLCLLNMYTLYQVIRSGNFLRQYVSRPSLCFPSMFIQVI